MRPLTLRTCVLLALTRLPMVTCQSGENFDQVLKDTLTLDASVRPVKNFTTTTVVTVSFHLMTIINFDTVEQKLVSNGFLIVQWNNDYVTWNPADYGGASLVTPRADKVWRPRLAMLNTMTELEPIAEENYIFIVASFDGSMFWYAAERFETFCRVDVTYFPFDIQTCEWKLFHWGGESTNTVDLKPRDPYIELPTFVPNGEWELRATRAWRTEGGGVVHIVYEVTLRRRPTLLALTVLLPVLVLSLVNVFVFTVPSESGERLSYSITSLLSFGVFLSFILDSMPSSSETLSIMAVHMSCQLVLSAVYVLLCILSLRLFHRDPVEHPVPSTVQSLIVRLEVLVCLHPPAKNRVDVSGVAVTDVTSTNVTDGHNEVEVKKGGLKAKLEKRAVTKNVKRAAYSDPEEMTWQRVSRTLDKLLFRLFLCIVLVSNGAVWGVMLNNYHNSI